MSEEDINRIDRLFEIGLVLASILSAAILQYASAMFSLLETSTTNTLHAKLSGINFVFRMTTVPLVILIFIWLIKEAYPSSWESRRPIRRWLKEFDWAFLGYFIFLDISLFVSLSFYTSYLWLSPLVLLMGAFSFILTFFATWQYKKCANTNAKIDLSFSRRTLLEHGFFVSVTYLILIGLFSLLASAPTPWI
jgi:hypothetical protein